MCFYCAIANQKGGVGKTTTAQNLAAALVRNHKKKVLLVDLDSQANLTDACGIDTKSLQRSTFTVLEGKIPLSEATVTLEERLDILPATVDLAIADIAFAARIGRENLLKKALAGAQYDHIIIDCPPTLGLLTVNALSAANALLIPVQVEYYALAGLNLIQETLNDVRINLNPNISILGLVLTLYDSRKKLNKDVEKALVEDWKEQVFTTRIRDNVALAEAPSDGKDILSYRPRSFGAEDYAALAKEYLVRCQALKK